MGRFNPKSQVATSLQKLFIEQVKHMPCIVCYYDWYLKPSDNFYGMCHSDADHVTDSGRRLGHDWILPLCQEHHTGNKGYSGNKKDWDSSFKNQLSLCRVLYAKLNRVMPEPETKIVRRR